MFPATSSFHRHSGTSVRGAIRPSTNGRRRTRFILTSLATVLVPSLALAADVTRIWDAADNNGTPTTNNNFYNNVNWSNDTRPTFTGNTDSLVFDGANSGSTITLNINGGLTTYLVKSLTFNSGSYTFNGGQNLTFGDATNSVNNTGNLTNNSSDTQTFNPNGIISFSFGTINAAGGAFTFGNNSTIDIGNQSAVAGRDVTVTGAYNVTINGVLQGVGTDTSAGGALIKKGTGTLFLQGDNASWGGRITIEEGILQINKGTALGTNDGRTTIAGGDSTGRLQVTGGISVSENFYLQGRTAGSTAAHLINTGGNNTLSGAIRLQAGGSEYGIISNGGSLTLKGGISYDTASGPTNLTLGGSAAGTIDGPIGTGNQAVSIIKTGSGTWTLKGVNEYSGSTQVSEGRLNLNTSNAGGGAISVADGATLGVSVLAAGQSLTVPSLFLGSSGGVTVALDLGGFGNTTAPLVTANNVTIAGNTTVQLSTGGGSLSIGAFPLIQYSDTLGGVGFGGLTLGSLPPRVTAALQDDATGKRILLNVTAFDIPVWTGALGSDWDATDEFGTGTQNWKELHSGNVTAFLQGPDGNDSVLFNDTATATAPGEVNVNLVTTLTPGIVTVDNSDLTYIFSGYGKLSGAASLVKKGSGTLILANTGANNYSGTTTIEAGTLQIGDGVTIGGGSVGTGPITNNGTLIIDRPDAVTVGPVIGGDGVIIKRGAGVATISSNNSYTGAVTVSAGTLKLGNANSLGSIAAGTTVENGATLDVNGKLVPIGEIITVSGFGVSDSGAIINTGTGGIGVGVRNVEFAGNTAFGGSNRWDLRDNPGALNANGFDLVKVGGNTIFLAGIGETHLGNVNITSGRLTLEGDATLGDRAGIVTIAAGAELGLENSAVAHTKPIQLEGGTILATLGSANDIAAPVTLVDSGILRVNNNITMTVSGTIGGTGYLNKINPGTLILSGNNTYDGVTIVTQGTLRVGSDGTSGNLGTGDVYLDALFGTTATLAFRRSDTSLVVSNRIISIGSGDNVVNIGANNNSGVLPSSIVTFTAENDFTGPVNINGGSLRITNSLALGVGTKTVSIESNNKSSLRLDGSSGNIHLSPELSFVTSNDDANYPAILNEVGNNSISGNIALNTGNGGNTRVRVNAGTSLTLNGAIAPASTSTSNRTLILDGEGEGTVNGIAADYSGPGTSRILSLTKAGTGTWTLNAANTYTGPTSVEGGTLKLGATASISSSPVIDVAAGAVLDVSAVTGFGLANNQLLTGSGTIAGNLTDGNGSVITPGGAGIGTLAFANDLTLNGGGKIQLNLTGSNTVGSGVNDLVSVGGDLAIHGATALELIASGERLTGSYQLINYGGSLAGTASNLTLSHQTRYSLSVDASTEGQIKVNVSGSAGNLTWSGDNGANVWNVDGAANWNNGNERFYQVDSVTFDDSTDNTAITIEGSVTPYGVTLEGGKNYTFVGSGGINGAPGGLTKNGAGTLTLITNNTYTGPTQVNDGTLIVTGSISGSAVSVANGAIIGGAGTITTNDQPFTLAAGARISPGSGVGNLRVNTGAASLDLSEAVAAFGSGALVFDLGAVNSSDRITLTGGTLNIGTGVLGFDDFEFTLRSGFGAGTYTLISSTTGIIGSLDANLANLEGVIGGLPATLSFGDNGTDIILTVVPEPSAAVSLLVGVGALLGTRRRRRPIR